MNVAIQVTMYLNESDKWRQTLQILRRESVAGQSRAHHCGDNGLVETKSGAVIRKHIGFGYIDAKHAEAVDRFHQQHLNP
ncbi:MAG: hypothetical protein WBY44_08460 [Bryobacteraceae bacterium]